jgi:hypothetical protein
VTSYYATGADLERELVACLTAFLESEAGHSAVVTARESGESATLELALVDPEVTLSVDFAVGSVLVGSAGAADVAIEMEADDLHDILLERMGPVQISQLYETDRLRFRGPAHHLAALIVLAAPLAPFYRETLTQHGRQDLLDTPASPMSFEWGSPEDPIKRVIGRRRPWQRPKRSAQAV